MRFVGVLHFQHTMMTFYPRRRFFFQFPSVPVFDSRFFKLAAKMLQKTRYWKGNERIKQVMMKLMHLFQLSTLPNKLSGSIQSITWSSNITEKNIVFPCLDVGPFTSMPFWVDSNIIDNFNLHANPRRQSKMERFVCDHFFSVS